jgi:hypothetical protein
LFILNVYTIPTLLRGLENEASTLHFKKSTSDLVHLIFYEIWFWLLCLSRTSLTFLQPIRSDIHCSRTTVLDTLSFLHITPFFCFQIGHVVHANTTLLTHIVLNTLTQNYELARCCSVIQLVANKGWYSDKRKINTTYLHLMHHKEHNYLDNQLFNYVILLLWTNSSDIPHYNILATFKGAFVCRIQNLFPGFSFPGMSSWEFYSKE